MSALGYSLWYSILPFLEKTIAALVQLLVPVIALTMSILFLNEKLFTSKVNEKNEFQITPVNKLIDHKTQLLWGT